MDWNEPITVAFTYDKAGQVIAVLIQEHDMTWSEVPFSVSGDEITLDLPHLTPVAFMFGEVEPAPSEDGGKTPGTSGTTPGTSTKYSSASTKKSPQTGYDTVLWAVLATAMAVGAGYCFSNTRKRVTA